MNHPITDPSHREELLQQSEWHAEIFMALYSGVQFLMPIGNSNCRFYHPDYAYKMITPEFLKTTHLRIKQGILCSGTIKEIETGVFCAESINHTCDSADYEIPQEYLQLAVKNRPALIAYIHEPSPELQLLAVSEDHTMILAIRNPTHNACKIAIQKDPRIIKDLEQTEELCLLALQIGCFDYIIRYIRIRTREFDTLLVRMNPSFYDTLAEPTEEQTVAYLVHYPSEIRKKGRTESIVMATIRECPAAIHYLPSYTWTDSVKDLVLSIKPEMIKEFVFQDDVERTKNVLIKHPHLLHAVICTIIHQPEILEVARITPQIAQYIPPEYCDLKELLAVNFPETLNYMKVSVSLFAKVCRAHPEFIPHKIPPDVDDWELIKTLVRKCPQLLPDSLPWHCDDMEYFEMVIKKNPRAVLTLSFPSEEMLEKAIRLDPTVAAKVKSRKLFLLALSVDGTVLHLVSEEKRDLELCQTAVKQTPEAMRFVPWKHREACWELLSKN